MVGYYFDIIDMEESMSGSTTLLNTIVINGASGITQNGTVFNFDYICVYDEEDKLLNEPTSDSYVQGGQYFTQDMLADQDQQTYGHYMRRAYAQDEYVTMTYPEPAYNMHIQKKMSLNGGLDTTVGGWKLKTTLSMCEYHKEFSAAEGKYLDALPDDEKILGWDIVDVLPLNTQLLSTSQEIINSMSLSRFEGTCYGFDEDGSVYVMDRSEFLALIKANTEIAIDEIWDNQIQLIIKIDLSEHPVTFSGSWDGIMDIRASHLGTYADLQIDIDCQFVYTYEGYLAERDTKTNNATVYNESMGYYHGREITDPTIPWYNNVKATFQYLPGIITVGPLANKYMATMYEGTNGDLNQNGTNEEYFYYAPAQVTVTVPIPPTPTS